MTYTYLYNGSQLLQETKGTKILDYSYDANGQVYAVRYRTNANDEGTYYYYAHNTRGDIVGLYNADGTLHAKYTYDVWGNKLSVTNASGAAITSQTDIANIQPFRYRSYYYDYESGFYYLQSRYYDPVTHRFINADGLVSTGTGVLGYNMFAYCENNPVVYSDPSGKSIVLSCIILGALIGATIGACIGASISEKQTGKVTPQSIGIGAAVGGVVGGLAGYGLGLAISAVAGATGGAVAATASVSEKASDVAWSVGDSFIKGKNGEIASGIIKNTSHIDSLSGTAKYRIPDMLDHSMRILGEVKNYSGKISYTAQLNDFVLWSHKYKYDMYLFTNSTSFSKPLKNLIDSGVIQVFPIG